MDLGINAVLSHGTHVLSIYAPFWMINKTGKMLVYKGQDPQNVIYHAPDLNQDEIPMMFSFVQKRFMGKRKASIRVENSNWSDPFTLDTIEDAGKVSCKAKNEVFNVGVNINMSKSSLTKIITFTPFYLIYNTTESVLEIWEIDVIGNVKISSIFNSFRIWLLAQATRAVLFILRREKVGFLPPLSLSLPLFLCVGHESPK